MSQSRDELEREARLVVARVPTDETIVPLRIVRALLDTLDEARVENEKLRQEICNRPWTGEHVQAMNQRASDTLDAAKAERDALRADLAAAEKQRDEACEEFAKMRDSRDEKQLQRDALLEAAKHARECRYISQCQECGPRLAKAISKAERKAP